MRLLIDSLICVMVVGLLAGLMWQHRHHQAQAKQRQDLRSALMMLHDTAAYHRALDQVADDVTTKRPGEGISPAWFADGVPTNQMVPGRQPWLDVAPKSDPHRHPPDPVITEPDQAGFWYNPRHGVFRARVMPQATEAATMELYNLVNQSSLKNLEPDTSLARRPELPMVLSMPRLAQQDRPVDLSRTGARLPSAKKSADRVDHRAGNGSRDPRHAPDVAQDRRRGDDAQNHHAHQHETPAQRSRDERGQAHDDEASQDKSERTLRIRPHVTGPSLRRD